MPYPAYRDAVVDCSKPPDISGLKNKSVVITGGAHGMGAATVRGFAEAGAFVTFGDLNEELGKKLEAELGRFVQCDVTDWDSQVKLFETAKKESPDKSVDVVIACAGISGVDPVFYDQDGEKPTKPTFKVLDVNVHGAIYTLTLARFWFLKNEIGPNRDRCFIIFSSLVGYVDNPGGPIYMASKFAARGLFRCMRRTTMIDGIRSNAVAPSYVKTGLMSRGVFDYVESKGAKFAEPADAAGALIKIASDPSINGRCLAVVHRDEAPLGYHDQQLDDYPEGYKSAPMRNARECHIGRLAGILIKTELIADGDFTLSFVCGDSRVYDRILLFAGGGSRPSQLLEMQGS